MGGIQVPRNAPVPTAPVGKINYQAPDFGKAEAVQSNAVEGLGKSIVDYQNREEVYQADTTSKAVATDYHSFLENNLEGPNGAKRVKGDPAPAYAKFDEDAKSKYQEIFDNNKDWSATTKAAVAKQLNEVNAKFYDRKTSALGAQSATYETSVTNDSVKIAKNDAMDATAHLDVNDPHTTVPLDNVIAKINDLRTMSGLKQGTVKQIQNEDGTYRYERNPSVNLQIAKDTSDAVKGAIDNLNAAGDVGGSKFLLEKYGDHLDLAAKPKIEEKTRQASIQVDGMNEFMAVKNLPPDAAIKKLDAIQDPNVREEALKNLDTEKRRIKNLETYSSRETYNGLAKYIRDKQSGNQPFTDVNAMQQDPYVKRALDGVKDPKQYLALQHLVDQPKDSNLDVKVKAYNTLHDGDFNGMSFTDFNGAVSGLDKKDRSYFETQWRNANDPKKAGEYEMTKYTGKELSSQLQQLGYVKKNQFGRFSNDDQNKISAANDEMVQMMKGLPTNISPAEMNSRVREFATSKAKGEVFNGFSQAPPKFQGTGKKDLPPKAPSDDTLTKVPGVVPPSTSKIDAQVQAQAYSQWKAANPGKPTSTTEIFKIYGQLMAAKAGSK